MLRKSPASDAHADIFKTLMFPEPFKSYKAFFPI